MRYLASIVYGGAVGVLLALIGYPANTWQFWPLLLLAQIPFQLWLMRRQP